MSAIRLARRRPLQLLLVAAVGVLTAGLLSLGTAGTGTASQLSGQGQAGPAALPKQSQVAFHDQMRKLWEDHVTWTRLAIVTFADGSAGFSATADRLFANQVDIGNAIKPFYGDAAGNRLTSLLHDHIAIAVELLQAARANDTAAFNDADTRWYANADDIADFLAAANPRFWPQAEMRDMMKVHLDQTLAEAGDELQGNYAASVADYDAVHQHILEMADTLSTGIMRAFPSAFH